MNLDEEDCINPQPENLDLQAEDLSAKIDGRESALLFIQNEDIRQDSAFKSEPIEAQNPFDDTPTPVPVIKGKYFDNDIGQFTSPHQDALNSEKIAKVAQVIEQIIAD